jgi:hypothetical protein
MILLSPKILNWKSTHTLGEQYYKFQSSDLGGAIIKIGIVQKGYRCSRNCPSIFEN